MEWIGKLCALALCGAFLTLLLKKQAPEYAFLTALACGLLLLFHVVSTLSSGIDSLTALLSVFPGGEAYLRPLVKAMGISVTTRLTAALCRDAGQTALGEKVDLLGTAACMLTALPLAGAVLELIGGML